MSQVTGFGAKKAWLSDEQPHQLLRGVGNERRSSPTALDHQAGAQRTHDWLGVRERHDVASAADIDLEQGKDARALIHTMAADGDLDAADAAVLTERFAGHAAEVTLNDLAAMMDSLSGMLYAGVITQEQFDRMHATVVDAVGAQAPQVDIQLRIVRPHPSEAMVSGDLVAERRVLREVATNGVLSAPDLDRLWGVLDIEPMTQMGVTSMRPSKETIARLGDELSQMEREGLIDAAQRQRMFGQIRQAASLGYMPGVSGHGMLQLLGLGA